jgi:hypothetical protein
MQDPLARGSGRDSSEPSYDSSSTVFKSVPVVATEQVPTKPKWKSALYGWYLEILWYIVSSGCFIALVFVLHQLNGQPLPKWPLGLTINTFIALLATVSRTGFIIPICESVSQLKWLWYQKERPLADLQAFDEAGPGAWGTLKLLFIMQTKAW